MPVLEEKIEITSPENNRASQVEKFLLAYICN